VRQLEVVAVSDDGTHVLLAGDENAARATHSVRIDTRLQAAIRGQLDESDDRRESELSPRDIQSRLRAGESAEEVAKVARIALTRVMRYAGPVISERDRIVEQAQAAVLHRSRGSEATTPLGEMVERRLAETVGLRPDSVVWSARRRDDGAWVVDLSYSARGGSRTASWLWQPAERELASLNGLGTRLGAEGPTGSRARRAPATPRSTTRRSARPATARRSAKRAAAKRSTAKRAAAKRAVAKRASAKRTAAKRSAAPAAKRSVAKRTAAKRVTAKRTTAKRAATKRAVAKPVTTRSPAKRATAKRSTARPPVTAEVTPPKRRTSLVAKSAKRAERAKPAPATEAVPRKNGRVEVPSWSDVLLGVQAPAGARGRRPS
jgi:hypothetical protein